MHETRVRVGLLGCGNVGGALAELLLADGDRIAERTGMVLELRAVAVRSLSRPRAASIPPELLTTDAQAVAADPDLDVVVEVIGGIEPARTLILAALGSGKPVVTANKELLANCGTELFDAAAAAGRDLLFEAAVAGGIPLIRPLRESLAGERIHRVLGIVNGTTNYILSQMAAHGASYQEALAEAQSLGFAERDPTADVEGFDAAAKAAVIAHVAFGARVVAGDVDREGIGAIGADDIVSAHRLGFVIKPLAVIEEVDGAIGVRVHPAMVPAAHPLASVRDSFNAVFVEGEAVGELMFLGRGAGGAPTASAVLGDLLDAAHNLTVGGAGRTPALRAVPRRSIDDLVSAYYLTLEVADRPGVLHAVAGVLGDHSVSVRSMEQEGAAEGARLVFVTHPALERDMQACLQELHALDAVRRVGGLIRVVGA
ncbi:homoserine dehydrogenase [Acidimicrobiaceae bacterium USS-CC1]|uniref:Homoserine dehydrogenase n=1 Tax=Acidiferrimicrobium australe TaxID=2664430 RepID=A0ABW9QTS3_9ACTN|nr:homoserine dehydrogenase [Acidiferrimicrobium australe]